MCRLTLGRDKLVALSGLAKLFHQQTCQDYVAGLWRDQLEHQLCWSTLFSFTTRPATYRAPTWSWASIDGTVLLSDFESSQHEPPSDCLSYIHVKSVDIELKSQDHPFGEILDAHLRIVCHHLYRGELASEPDGRDSVVVVNISGKSATFRALLDCLDRRFGNQLEVYFLLTAYKQGLILWKTCVKPGQYERIGVFSNNAFDGDGNYGANLDFQHENWDYTPDDGDYSEIYSDEQGVIQRVIDRV
jgi:hypothetical protein